MNPTIAGIGIAIVIVVLMLGDFGARAQDEAWTNDEVAVARLCVSERSFATSRDCDLIAGIVTRLARATGLSIAEYVATYHHRHTRSLSRPWIGHLSATLEEPEGWPSESISWDRGRELFRMTLADVRDALSRAPARCNGRAPITWGGFVDRDRIARMTGPDGFYDELDCGHTINRFLARRGER